MIAAILFIAFFIFLIIGIPIGISLGLSSICAILYSGTDLTIVATNMYSGISKFLLLAIPFFVLSGNIMAKAKKLRYGKQTSALNIQCSYALQTLRNPPPA